MTVGRLSVQVKSLCCKAPIVVTMVQWVTKMRCSMSAQEPPLSNGYDAFSNRATTGNALINRAAAKVVVLAEMASSIPT